MEQPIVDLLAWLEPRALLLAVLLPPVVRILGHWLPEELFMISMGVLAARSNSPGLAATLLAAVLASHCVTDHTVYLLGRWARPRLRRFPRVHSRLERITARLDSSPSALFGLIPARVFPLGRGAWLASCGVVGISWRRFAAVDLLALCVHLAVWCGLGWWLSEDLTRLQDYAGAWRSVALWLGVGLISAVAAYLLWRRRPQWQPATVRAMRRAGDSLRHWRS